MADEEWFQARQEQYRCRKRAREAENRADEEVEARRIQNLWASGFTPMQIDLAPPRDLAERRRRRTGEELTDAREYALTRSEYCLREERFAAEEEAYRIKPAEDKAWAQRREERTRLEVERRLEAEVRAAASWEERKRQLEEERAWAEELKQCAAAARGSVAVPHPQACPDCGRLIVIKPEFGSYGDFFRYEAGHPTCFHDCTTPGSTGSERLSSKVPSGQPAAQAPRYGHDSGRSGRWTACRMCGCRIPAGSPQDLCGSCL